MNREQHHGVDKLEIECWPFLPVKTKKLSVISLVSSAPKGLINILTLRISEKDGVQFIDEVLDLLFCNPCALYMRTVSGPF